MINISGESITKMRYVEKKLKFINSIIDEILPAEAAIEYKLEVKNGYVKWRALIGIQMILLVVKLLLRRELKLSFINTKTRIARYKILSLFLAAECLTIIISINKKGNFILKFPFLFSFPISFCFSPILFRV